MPKISNYNTVYFLRYTHPRYMKCLFKNIQEQYNMSTFTTIENILLFKKKAHFTGK